MRLRSAAADSRRCTEDSSVADFVRTYAIGRHGKAVASPTGAVFTDEADGRMRTVRVEYVKREGTKPYTGIDPLGEPRLGTRPATIIVSAED